jgi:hypothetical protein
MPSSPKAAIEAAHLADKVVRVECYSGYKAEERPVRILLGEKMVDIAEVEDRWYSPDATYFRILLPNGDRYVLRRDDAQDVWTLQAFRASSSR